MSRPITRLLVANRGEIARRVIRTADELGIETVAVFSDPDRGLPFVDEATYAVALGGTTSAESYLDAAKVLDAARRTGADAIHPGYGFLSENPDFAEAVAAAGLVWVGPTPSSMRAMALKVEAKRIAADAGVPLVPGAELSADVSDADLLATGERVGFPLLVKASAGGGGKGMRVVRSSAELLESVAGARREAASSFGDPTVFLERYLERSRHVEVQVFGDAHGHVVHLFERECSIQRRHQKVVEESPSPGATASTLEGMYAAAVSLAKAIGYVGAGTVEFLVAGEGSAQEFFFLEMNTRLQVEHPVTELVTGLDLVEWQVRVASGEPLPLEQHAIERAGHAIEVRLYAEDPANGYLPSTGTLEAWDLEEWEPSARIDSAVEAGSVVSPYYDPMLAKVICSGATRAEAAADLAQVLRSAGIRGVTTNAAMLAAVLTSPSFLDGDTTTAFLDEHPEVLAPQPGPAELRRHLMAAAVAILEAPAPGLSASGPSTPSSSASPGSWASAGSASAGSSASPAGWRNVAGVPETLALRYRIGASERTAVVAREWGRDGATYWLCPDAGSDDVVPAQTIASDERFERIDGVRADGPTFPGPRYLDELRLEIDGVRSSYNVELRRTGQAAEPGWHGAVDATSVSGVLVRSDALALDVDVVEPGASGSHDGGGTGPTTPVPGTVTHVAVEVGDTVVAGQALVVLEAMKMEHTIRADADGTVAELHVTLGQSVDAHTVVATVTPS
jgi:3-methylcrotonyl-CoA carboxylase alpha subunit